MKLSPVAVLALAACLCVGHVAGQNPNAKPNYGEKILKAGFTPDPFVVNVEAGGTIKTNLGGVNAFVDGAPDFRVRYTAGSLPLIFRVESKADTTLLINLPDGTWIADDDAGGNLNPRIRIPQPKSGQYDIWVGTLNNNGTPPAQLIVSEIK